MGTSRDNGPFPPGDNTPVDRSGGAAPLDVIADWPVPEAAAVALSPAGTLAAAGNTTRSFRIASLTKMLVAYAVLIALEEQSLDLDQPAGPDGSTVRHLLAHASGLPFRGADPIAVPGKRRIYSNTGFDRLGEALTDSTGLPVATYLAEAVLVPLGLGDTQLQGSPAYAARSTADDLARFARELLTPTLVAPETLAEATTEQFAGLGGVIPGLGRFDPNPWGLGFEIKGDKSPHWTAPDGSPRTFGHFGGAGTFLWVDPDARLACVGLTNREFGDWAPPLWQSLSSAVLALGTATGR